SRRSCRLLLRPAPQLLGQVSFLQAVVVNDGGGVVDTVRLSWLPTAEGVLSCHVISSEDPGSLQRLSSTAKVSCPITNSKPEDIRYSSIGERYLHNPTVELGEVDLTDILRAEEGISSLFPDRPTLLVPYRTGEETDEPAGRKPNVGTTPRTLYCLRWTGPHPSTRHY
ncbi:hypothetical protein FOZ62_019792, partial [Perkinsus olseni]